MIIIKAPIIVSQIPDIMRFRSGWGAGKPTIALNPKASTTLKSPPGTREILNPKPKLPIWPQDRCVARKLRDARMAS